jgi:two-component system nitrate/nitrite sensor histidine kinase NarX
MPRAAADTPALNKGQTKTLRSRLLIRLLGLLVILAVSSLLFIVSRPETDSAANHSFLSIALFVTGAALVISILLLVQNQLLDPLSNVKLWARKMREGRYTDPIPSPAYSAFAELADDLNLLGKRMSAVNNGRDTARFNEQELEEKSLQILYEVVSGINAAHGLDDLLTRFMFTLKRITQSRAAAIWVAQKQGQMELSASSGIDDELILPDRQEVHRSLYERAVTEGKIWVEDDLVKCEKIAGRRFFEQDDIGLVSVPMRYRGKVTGVINLFLGQDLIEKIESVKPLLISIAHHLSIAIEKSRNEEENQRHLIRDERTRIAHELHDSLAQTLASLRFQVRVLDETLHQGDESTTWQQLERIENSLDEANTELRELIGTFRAPSYNQNLLDAIEKIVSQFRNETRIKTFLQKEWSNITLPKDTETQILRIIQEALWNIRKHSEAKTVRIMLRNSPHGQCYILIEDDGIGINKQVYGSPGEHIGLTIMRERASRLGGELRVESESGEGTRIILELNQPGPESTPS